MQERREIQENGNWKVQMMRFINLFEMKTRTIKISICTKKLYVFVFKCNNIIKKDATSIDRKNLELFM